MNCHVSTLDAYASIDRFDWIVFWLVSVSIDGAVAAIEQSRGLSAKRLACIYSTMMFGLEDAGEFGSL